MTYTQKITFGEMRKSKSDVTRAKSLRLLDHLIGLGEQHRWHFEAERFRSLEIDAQLEFDRLVKRDISRISTAKNLIDEVSEVAIHFR